MSLCPTVCAEHQRGPNYGAPRPARVGRERSPFPVHTGSTLSHGHWRDSTVQRKTTERNLPAGIHCQRWLGEPAGPAIAQTPARELRASHISQPHDGLAREVDQDHAAVPGSPRGPQARQEDRRDATCDPAVQSQAHMAQRETLQSSREETMPGIEEGQGPKPLCCLPPC